MPDIKEDVGIKEKIHIVLRGPDGKVKEERKTRDPIKTTEVRNVQGKDTGVS